MKNARMMALCLLTSLACASTNFQESANGLSHETIPYEIKYLDRSNKQLLDARWSNKTDDHASETFSVTYTNPLPIRFSDRTESFRKYEGYYENKQDNGVIFFASSPLPENLMEKRMDILARVVIENIAQDRNYFTDSKARLTLEGLDMLTKKIDIVSIDIGKQSKNRDSESIEAQAEVKTTGSVGTQKIKLVLIKPNSGWKPKRFKTPRSTGSTKEPTNDAPIPSLMIYTYKNRSDDFAKSEGDFDNLVGRVEFLSAK